MRSVFIGKTDDSGNNEDGWSAIHRPVSANFPHEMANGFLGVVSANLG
jgi:hypothetical protein